MASKKIDASVEPKPFKLSDHFDVVEREATKFGVPTKRALTVADEVDEEREAAVVVTTTRKESELREVFEDIYDHEVARREFCPIEGCGERLKTIKQALGHMRIHLLFESDWRTILATSRAIEEQVFPAVEQEVAVALTATQRTELLAKVADARKQLMSKKPN